MQNRRKFIKNSLLTLTTAGFAGKYYNSPAQESGLKEGSSIYRTLGKTGIKIPIVSMGTGNTSNPGLVRSALDKGISLLGTSEAYQNGNNEKMVGVAIKEVPRDSFMIMTSCGDLSIIDTQTGVINSSFTHDGFLKKVKASLSRLGVEYVDIYIQPFAGSRESVFNKSVIKAFETIKSEGLAKYTGIATHRNEPEAIRAAVDVGIHDVIMTSYNFRKTNNEDLEDAIKYAADADLGIIAMKTMAGAFWDGERTKPINTRAALKWVLQNENIHTTVPDCSNHDQLLQNLEIMSDLKLTEEEIKDLKVPSGQLTSGIYCQQCGACQHQCPHGVDVPTLMRSYMYAFGHRNLPHAKLCMASTGLTKNPCSKCVICDINCKMGFDIKQKIEAITRIIDIPLDFLHV
jgi:predicted aldo/keto reductase-like oxidoreductase